jgi:hypothetical protein
VSGEKLNLDYHRVQLEYELWLYYQAIMIGFGLACHNFRRPHQEVKRCNRDSANGKRFTLLHQLRTQDFEEKEPH